MCPVPPPPKTYAAPPSNVEPWAAKPPSTGKFTVTTGRLVGAQKVVIYGPGGIGKSSLAALAPKPIFLDIERSTNRLDVNRIENIETWAQLRECLQSSALDEYQTIVIDSATKAEEMAVAHTLLTVKNDKQAFPTSVEGYGFGKGYQHVYDTFLHLLVDCDRHVRAGRNVVFVTHVCTAKVPNPTGEDFIRYEPRLQQTKEGKASIRNRIVEWADHVLFLGYDVIAEDNKGTGGGTRTITTKETPTQIAKVREMEGVRIDNRPYKNEKDGSIWPLLLAVKGGAS